MFDRLQATAKEDQGMVLIAVIGLLMIVSVLGIAAYTMSDDNHRLSEREQRSTVALHVAEAGLESGMWKVGKYTDAAPSDFSVALPDGTAQVKITKSGTYAFTIVSVATAEGTPTVQRTVSTEVFAMSLWNLVLASGSASPVGSGGGHFNGNGTLTGPFYMRGNLDFSNGNSAFYGGPLFVKKGDISLAGSSEIGKVGQPVEIYCDGQYPVGNPNFRPKGEVSPNVPDISLPRVSDHMNDYRAAAMEESVDARIGTRGAGGTNTETRTIDPPSPPGKYLSYYKVIDSDGAINKSSAGLVISPATSFGASTDDFAVVGGVLYIRGTVFVDGPVTIQGPISYSGNGTIVANGDINVYGNLLPVGDFPSVDALGLTSTSSVIIQVNGSSVKAAVYASNSLQMNDNNQRLEGAVLTNTFGLPHGGEIITQPQLPAYLPPSLPGGGESLVFPAAWHDGPK